MVHTLSHADYHATDFTVWQQVAALGCLHRCAHGYRTRKKKRDVDGGMSLGMSRLGRL